MKHQPFAFRLMRWTLAAVFAWVASAALAVEYVAVLGPVRVDTRRPDLTVTTLSNPLQAVTASTSSVAWSLLNKGAAPTPGSWVDRVYLSTNAAGTDGILVGEFPASGPLGTNQSLPRTQSITLPADLEPDRSYWLSVVTDAANAMDESNETNNTRVSSQPMRLMRPSNLRVAAVIISANPRASQPVTVTWAVTNVGGWSTGTNLWQDAVYLSATTNLDGTALLLGQITCPGPLDTSASYTNNLIATLPLGFSGTHYFIFQTDADSRVSEGDFENDNTTVSVPVTIGLPPPDLQVAAIQAPISGLSGASLAVSWIVTNAGPGVIAETAWVEEVYLSSTNTLGTNLILLGTFPASGPLGANQSFSRTQSIALPAELEPDRNYWWIVVTDATNAIDEANEANNTRVSDLPMRLPSPNLRVASVSVSANAWSGQPVTITWAVTNAGASSTGTDLWQDAVYLSSKTNLDGTALLLGQSTCPRPLDTNESYASSLIATLPQGLTGNRYLIVQTDADRRVKEGAFEDDNTTASPPVTITLPPPDLQVAAIQAPTNGLSGASLAVSWTVTNAGPGVTAQTGWVDEVYLSPTNILGTNRILLGAFVHHGALTHGQAYDSFAALSLPFPLSGSFYLLIHTDARSDVFEGVFETNNVAASANPILITLPPDLQVAAIQAPTNGLFGASLAVSWTVTNAGPGVIVETAWVDEVYLSPTNTLGADAILLGAFPASGPLGANQSLPRLQSFTLPADLEPDRDYWWVVVTDATNAIYEVNEANNIRVSDQPLRLPPPNLRVASVSVSADPWSGQPVTVTWVVTNASTWRTGTGLWQDAVYLSATPNLDGTALLLGQLTCPRALGPNEGYVGSLTATLPRGLSGTRYFIVQTDADSRVNEGAFEGDNTTASAPVVITLTPPPDLQVIGIQVPTNAGATLAVSWSVTNAGPGVTAETAWVDEVYLSPTNTLGAAAILLGTFPRDGALTNGRAYHCSATIPLPLPLNGSFYLLVHTDAHSNVFEYVFETNNLTASANPILITPAPQPDDFTPGADFDVSSLVPLPDGRVIAAGGFSVLGGQPRSGLGCLNSAGVLDTNFTAETGGGMYDWGVRAVAVLRDGKIMVGGKFDTLGGQPRLNLARLNANGTLDTNFNLGAGGISAPSVWCLAVQADGKVLVGGKFWTLGGQEAIAIARLNADGSRDTGFTPSTTSVVTCIAVQADGKILVGGMFSAIFGPNSGGDYKGLARLNPDGTVDSGFNPGVDTLGGWGYPEALAVQADGKILVGGGFHTLCGQIRNSIGRLNPDGTLDSTFNPGAGARVYSLAVQADGKILVGGNFHTLGGQARNGIGRLHPDGALDASFNPGADDEVHALAVQADGKILAGGYFSILGGQLRWRLGRLNNTEATTQSLGYDGTNVTWLRGGTSPEVWRTTYDYCTNGTDWINLGDGTRIAGGWQLGGVTLPAGASLRARGQVTGGYYTASAWFVETGISLVGPKLSFKILPSGFATISWPETPGFVLQTTGDLSNTNWANAPSSTTNSATVPAAASAGFYRLIKQ